jgi:hypothetical protein
VRLKPVHCPGADDPVRRRAATAVCVASVKANRRVVVRQGWIMGISLCNGNVLEAELPLAAAWCMGVRIEAEGYTISSQDQPARVYRGPVEQRKE